MVILGGCGGAASSQVDFYGAKAVAAAYVGSIVVESDDCGHDAPACTRNLIDTLTSGDFELSDDQRAKVLTYAADGVAPYCAECLAMLDRARADIGSS